MFWEKRYFVRIQEPRCPDDAVVFPILGSADVGWAWRGVASRESAEGGYSCIRYVFLVISFVLWFYVPRTRGGAGTAVGRRAEAGVDESRAVARVGAAQ